MSQKMIEYIVDEHNIDIEPEILKKVKVWQMPLWFLLCSAILY